MGTEQEEVSLSSRTARVASFFDPVRIASKEVTTNQYHETRNPEGIIDMCMSQNTLISDVILAKLHEADMLKWDEGMLRYTEQGGIRELRMALSDYLAEQTNATTPLDPEKMVVMNGVTAIMNVLTFVLFEEGDTVLCPAPFYYSIPRDVRYISNINTYPIRLNSQPGSDESKPFELMVTLLEEALAKATEEGHSVKGVFLVNPINPLGLVYTKDQVLAYLAFCKKHKLHAIMDEIYLGSIHNENTPNSSVLGLPLESIPDSERTHFLYGFSKDFGIPGAPLSVLYSWNRKVIDLCKELGDFHLASSFIQVAAAKMLNDKEWLRKVYFPTNLSRLRDACQVAMETLEELGVTFVKPQAGLFVWANFSKFLSASTAEEEERFTRHLLNCGVGLSPSVGYCGGEFGWFRMMFAIPRPRFMEGLKRLQRACLSFPACSATAE